MAGMFAVLYGVVAYGVFFFTILYSIGFVAICWIPVSLLYRRSIFIRI